MAIYRLYLQHILRATLDIEAESSEDARQKWEDGKFHMEDIQHKGMIGGVVWDLNRIIEMPKS